MDIAIGPVDDGMNLDASILHSDDFEFFPGAGLRAAQAGQPGAGPEFPERPLHGLDFDELVIAREALETLFPQLTVPGLQPGGRQRGAVNLEVELQAGGQLVGKTIGFRK